MLRRFIGLLVVLLPLVVWGQNTYMEDMLEYRQEYKESLLNGKLGLKPEDTAYLRFFDIDPRYQVRAVFEPIGGRKPYPIQTAYGGTRKAVSVYGYVYFNLMGASLKLYVLRFMASENIPGASDQLFIAFTDRTNYRETFHGGRYLDLSITDIKDNFVMLDFNRCYNPHTAYQKGYPYIIPPTENDLRIDINAGEKIFGHNPGY